MKIFGTSILDNVDIARALMDRRIAFRYAPDGKGFENRNSYFVVADSDSHLAQRSVDEVLAKSRYRFGPGE